jgi:hypothetical protein
VFLDGAAGSVVANTSLQNTKIRANAGHGLRARYVAQLTINGTASRPNSPIDSPARSTPSLAD